jgi:hypothetical protein
MIEFLPLERENQDPGFQKEYLNLIDEDPTSVRPNEIEKTRQRASGRSSRFSKESAPNV